MAINYAYAYAEINNATNMCIGIVDSSNPNLAGPTSVGTTYILLPEYSDEYFLKYYDFDTGKWYYDSAMTQEFILE